MKNIFLFLPVNLLSFLVIPNCFSQQTQTLVSKDTVFANEPFKVEYVIDLYLDSFKITRNESCNTVTNRSSKSWSTVNKVEKLSTTYTYIFSPSGTGVINLPEGTFKDNKGNLYASTPRTVVVLDKQLPASDVAAINNQLAKKDFVYDDVFKKIDEQKPEVGVEQLFFSVTVDRSKVKVGESINLICATNSAGVQIEMPVQQLKKDFEVNSGNLFDALFNTKYHTTTVSKHILTCTLKPLHKGKIIIPAITARFQSKNFVSKPITIKVTDK